MPEGVADGPAYLVSYSEHSPEMKTLGPASVTPENYGVDVVWVSRRMGYAVGVQRKEIKDLVQSVKDGRLAKEVAQMQDLGQAMLVVEGRLRWGTNGELMVDQWTKWNRQAHRSLLMSIQSRGIWVETSDDIADTVRVIREMAKYLEKDRHDTLLRRPKPAGSWGQVTHRDWAIHLLQSVPGIGPGMADRIIEHFGGVPMQWTVGAAELQEVAGIGKGRAEAMIKALGGTDDV